MTQFLLDVNVLIALHTPSHASFRLAQRWFHSKGADNFSTCAITQSGFIRISAQIALEENVGFEEAKIALNALIAQPGHALSPIDIGYLAATASFGSRIHGHRQITDAYLLGLALHHYGKLATLDRAILHLAGTEFRDSVELIE